MRVRPSQSGARTGSSQTVQDGTRAGTVREPRSSRQVCTAAVHSCGTVVGSPWVKPGLRWGGDQQRRGPRALPPYTLCSGQTRSHVAADKSGPGRSREPRSSSQDCTAAARAARRQYSTVESRAAAVRSEHSSSAQYRQYESREAAVQHSREPCCGSQIRTAAAHGPGRSRAAQQQSGLHSGSAQLRTVREPRGSSSE